MGSLRSILALTVAAASVGCAHNKQAEEPTPQQREMTSLRGDVTTLQGQVSTLQGQVSSIEETNTRQDATLSKYEQALATLEEQRKKNAEFKEMVDAALAEDQEAIDALRGDQRSAARKLLEQQAADWYKENVSTGQTLEGATCKCTVTLNEKWGAAAAAGADPANLPAYVNKRNRLACEKGAMTAYRWCTGGVQAGDGTLTFDMTSAGFSAKKPWCQVISRWGGGQIGIGGSGRVPTPGGK